MEWKKDRWQRPLRFLSAGFIVSLSLNIFLIGYVAYLKLENQNFSLPDFPFAQKNEKSDVHLTNNQIYQEFHQLRTEDLSKQLRDERWADDGIQVRDIALGVLVRERFFDIEKVLGKVPTSREVTFNMTRLPLFSGLSAMQYEALASFGEREKWPMTPQGMFIVLQKLTEANPSLEEAFMLTEPFQKVAKLLPKAESRRVLELVLQGDWQMLTIEASSGTELLVRYLEGGSSKSAGLLLAYYPNYAVKKLNDEQALKLLQLSKERSSAMAKYALSLMSSQRSNEVKTLAMQKLSAMSEKVAMLTKPEGEYVVQSGDNLWKIAKKLNVTLESLKTKNRLGDEAVLQPGSVLVVPR